MEPNEEAGRIICNSNGYLVVGIGGGAQMTCPTGDAEWECRYGQAKNLTAASIIDSFEYLVMHCSKDEAWRRIKIMRAAMKSRAASTDKESLG